MYTKGGWKVGARTEQDFHDNLLMITGGFNKTTGGFPAICYLNDLVNEEQANARLIAAAPDMYEACKEGLEFIGELRQLMPESEIEERMSKALDKAGGEMMEYTKGKWKLTDKEKAYCDETGADIPKAQAAKKQAYLDTGGIILNPEALEDMYEALKVLSFQFAAAVEHPYSKDKEVYEQAQQAIAKVENNG